MANPEPSIAIVIPAYNAAATLALVLDGAKRAATGQDVRILVVDPGSDDATPEIARSAGVDLLQLGERAGPAKARNRGVAQVDTDVVLFIDSDCVPHSDVVERVRTAFAADPHLVSLCGSYDASPPNGGFASHYMNLRHHFTHQHAQREGATFWAGCGALRRDTFLAVGGFDELKYPMPMIEDTELGLRLRDKGRTALDPQLNATHLKNWSLANVVETDIWKRGVPWSELILERGEMPNDLNLKLSQRIAAAFSPFVLLAVPALPAALALGHTALAATALLLLGGSLAFHWPLVRCFAASRGVAFAIGAWLFHQVHLTYSAATFALCTLRHKLWRRANASGVVG